jgi:hypothetical protein
MSSKMLEKVCAALIGCPAQRRKRIAPLLLDLVVMLRDAKEWNEADHTRKKNGEFSKGAGGGNQEKKAKFDPEAERAKIKSGAYPSKVVKGRQRGHMKGTREFEQKAEKMERRSPGSKPSILRADPKALIDKYKGTGEIHQGYDFNSLREYIVTDKIIGQTWVKEKSKYVDTKTFEIVYSNKGVHIFPSNNYGKERGDSNDAD